MMINGEGTRTDIDALVSEMLGKARGEYYDYDTDLDQMIREHKEARDA